MARGRSLTRKQEERRYRILSAVRDLMGTEGYQGMLMSQVAEKAGVSPTTLYNLYNTKDDLILEAVTDLMAENTNKVMKNSRGPGRERLLQYFRNGPDMAISEPAYSEAITHAFLRAEFGDALVEVLLVLPRIELLSSLSQMDRSGELKPHIDVEELATLLVGVYWSAFIMRDKGLLQLENLERGVLINVLSMLVASTQGDAHEELEAELEKTVAG